MIYILQHVENSVVGHMLAVITIVDVLYADVDVVIEEWEEAAEEFIVCIFVLISCNCICHQYAFGYYFPSSIEAFTYKHQSKLCKFLDGVEFKKI